jgi:hypothetical protein
MAEFIPEATRGKSRQIVSSKIMVMKIFPNFSLFSEKSSKGNSQLEKFSAVATAFLPTGVTN